jgi:hypothetical protein
VATALIGTLIALPYINPQPEPAPFTTITKVTKLDPAVRKSTPEAGDLVVKASLGHRGPASLVEALEQVAPNRRIFLSTRSSGEWDVAPLVVGEGSLRRCEGVHVVGDTPSVAVSTQSPDQPLLRIKKVKGFVLKDLTIEGNGRNAPLITIEGDGVSDCRIENVVFQNFKGDAIQLIGARGKKEAPVVVKNCRFQGSDQARGVVVLPFAEDPSPTTHVVIEGNRFFSCASAIAVQGPLAVAVAKGNIFATGGIGVQFAPGTGSTLLQELRIETSTFWRMAAGVALEDAPTAAAKIVVADSLFVEVGLPPVVASPAAAVQLKAAPAGLESNGLWADAAKAPVPPESRVPVGATPTVGTVEFAEIDAQKGAFLQPKVPVGGGKSPPRRNVGAVEPATR